MRYFSLFFLFIISIATKAQQRLEYGNFLQLDKEIQWSAIYHSVLNLTPVNPNYDIWKFYERKLSSGPVSIYIPDSSTFAVERMQVKYAEYMAGISKIPFDAQEMNWKYDFADGNNTAESIFRNERSTCDSCFLDGKFSLMKVKQLIYYKNHQLYVQNVLLQPVFYTKTDYPERDNAKFYIGDAIAFNDSLTNNTIPAKAIFICRTSNLLNLSSLTKNENRVLTNYNHNLSLILYKDIKKDHIHAYNTESSLIPGTKYLKKDSLDYYHNPVIEVPVFDSTGIIVGNKFIFSEINFDSIYHYSLIQDIYFDFTKEILYSKVVALVPFMNVITSAGVDLGLAPYWGVDFKRRKIQKKK